VSGHAMDRAQSFNRATLQDTCLHMFPKMKPHVLPSMLCKAAGVLSGVSL